MRQMCNGLRVTKSWLCLPLEGCAIWDLKTLLESVKNYTELEISCPLKYIFLASRGYEEISNIVNEEGCGSNYLLFQNNSVEKRCTWFFYPYCSIDNKFELVSTKLNQWLFMIHPYWINSIYHFVMKRGMFVMVNFCLKRCGRKQAYLYLRIRLFCYSWNLS
jgi:hypothetical protein